MTKQADKDWRQSVVEMLPRMEANAGTGPATGGLTPATTAADFGPISFHGNRTPDDPAALLDGLPLVKMTALNQRALDLHGAIPSFDDVQQVRLDKQQHANRIAKLVAHRSEGGFGLGDDAPQVSVERKKLERAEQELARLTSLQEIRTGRWNSASQLSQSVADWLLRGGVPQGCQIETFEDAPLSELLKKGETIATAVERFRLRRRELAADLHRVRSSPWPSSLAKVAAKELIDRLADAGMPNLDGAIEHNLPISFATTRLQSLVYNTSAGAIAYGESPDAIGLRGCSAIS
jgi:hypothetical protein